MKRADASYCNSSLQSNIVYTANRRRALTTTALCSLAALACFEVQAAYAQQVAATDDKVEEIVITARRKSERLQDVPLAVSAVTAQTIENSGARDLRGILDQTTGVTLVGSASDAGEAPVIRGTYDFNNSSAGGGQPNVAIFLDGIYLQNSNAISLGVLGLERVEIVKGPVSASYGRNGFAGAINYVSKIPNDDLEVDARAAFGEYGTRALSGYISGPVVPGKLRLGIGYNYENSDGPYQDAVDGLRAGGFEKKDVKFTFDFAATDDLDITGGYYYGQDTFDQNALVLATPNCEGNTFQCGEFIANPVQVANIPPSAGAFGNKREVQAGHLKISYDLHFADLSYLGGYNRVTERSYEDFAGLRNGVAFPLTPGPGTFNTFVLFGSDDNTEDSSHEIRLASKQDQKLRGAVGVDYFQSRLFTTTLIGADGALIPAGQTISNANNFFLSGLFVTPNGGPSSSNFTGSYSTERTYSAFGSLEYDILDNLTVAGEFRDTLDRQFLDIQRNSFVANVFRPYGVIPASGFHFNNYRTNIKYKFDEDLLAYFSAASGTKAGGFNRQSQIAANQSYGPEKNTTYEGGLKTEFLDKKLLVDLAVYHIDATGIQLSFPQGNGINTVIQNIGGTENTGFELTGTYKPLPGLTLNAGFAYTDPEFISGSYDVPGAGYCAALASCAGRVVTLPGGTKATDLTGLVVPGASKYSVNLSADYYHMVYEDYEGFVHGDYKYQSKQYTSVELADLSYTRATNQLNLRIGVDRGPVTVAFYVQNVLDDQTPLNIARATELNSFVSGFEFMGSLPNPRTFGGELDIHFGEPLAASPAYEAPAPMPAPAPAPAPAPVAAAPEAARSFEVFFDFDKSDITSAAAQVIQAAADSVKSGHIVQITVTGHTDTVGAAAYNQALSERRAAAVKAGLIADGVPNGEISASGVGKTGLLVPTGDGVREPQNRRAEIVLK